MEKKLYLHWTCTYFFLWLLPKQYKYHDYICNIDLALRDDLKYTGRICIVLCKYCTILPKGLGFGCLLGVLETIPCSYLDDVTG
jgi:hypothetical protein